MKKKTLCQRCRCVNCKMKREINKQVLELLHKFKTDRKEYLGDSNE